MKDCQSWNKEDCRFRQRIGWEFMKSRDLRRINILSTHVPLSPYIKVLQCVIVEKIWEMEEVTLMSSWVPHSIKTFIYDSPSTCSSFCLRNSSPRLVTSTGLGGRWVESASLLGQRSAVLLKWHISWAAPHCRWGGQDRASRSVDTLWGRAGGKRKCDVHIHGSCVCMQLLGAGGLSGNLSTLINVINLNRRVDLASTKKTPDFPLKPFPTLTSRPFTITTQRTRDRGNIAGSIFKTCFCCAPRVTQFSQSGSGEVRHRIYRA